MNEIIIDCDPGIDDALALLLAAGSKEIKLAAVTTVAGNRPVDITSANARKILNLAGLQHVPVHAGAARPFGHAQARCNLVHGEDGLGGVDLGAAAPVQGGHAAIKLVELLHARPANSLTLIAVGPLTNLALAESLSPGVLARARQVLIMGGALRCPGNVTPAAEFNFYADPVAAEMVMAAGAHVVLFPLDVTNLAVMPMEWIRSFAGLGTRCGRAASAMLEAYAELDPLLHDACPVAWLLDSSLFSGERCHLSVDWRPGATEGHCIARFGTPQEDRYTANVTAMTAVQTEGLLDLVRCCIATLP